MYTLPTLRYDYDALEPHIAGSVLRDHHLRHHGGYTDRLNAVLEHHPDQQGGIVEDLLRRLPDLPPATRDVIENPAGGFANHQFQWKVIGPEGGGTPVGALAEGIERSFGSFAAFRDDFLAAASAHVGSGWAFLATGRFGAPELEILVLPNNGSVLPLGKPGVLVCDLWEHAYEAQHPAQRDAYLEAFFKVVDWAVCGERYATFISGRLHLT